MSADDIVKNLLASAQEAADGSAAIGSLNASADYAQNVLLHHYRGNPTAASKGAIDFTCRLFATASIVSPQTMSKRNFMEIVSKTYDIMHSYQSAAIPEQKGKSK